MSYNYLVLFSHEVVSYSCNPMTLCSTAGFPVFHYLPNLLKLKFIESDI